MDVAKKPIRAFLGIDIDEACRQQINQIIHQLSRDIKGGKIRWVPPENLHITLRFLGNLPHDHIKPLLRTIQQHAEHIHCFSLKPGKIDCFPHQHPHYYAITIELNAELAVLAKAINTAVSEFGIEPDKRPFFPHLT